MTVELILYLFPALLVAAALQDIARLRISNLFPLTIILLFGLWVFVQGPPDNWWENALHFLIALAIGMGLFALRWIGGGDAKLYAACALWFDLGNAVILFFLVSLAGILLLAVMLLGRRMRKKTGAENKDNPQPPKVRAIKLPYGVAIASGTIVTMILATVNPPLQDGFDPLSLPLSTEAFFQMHQVEPPGTYDREAALPSAISS